MSLRKVRLYGDDTQERKNDVEGRLVVRGKRNQESSIQKYKQTEAEHEQQKARMPTTKDLYFDRERVKKQRMMIYEGVLKDIIKEIVRANGEEQTSIITSVPQSILYNPNYDFRECMSYVVNRLRNDGHYYVYFMQPNLLIVSWEVRIEAKRARTEQNIDISSILNRLKK